MGSSAHADDVRAACNSIAGLQTQANLIASFCDANDLSLNANKTELIKFSIGAFHGRLNPLTGQSLFETFVIPTLLYGCETWIHSEPLLESLESFQAEIGKRILGISKYHSNISTRIGLHWPSMKARILLRKLKSSK